MSIKEELRLEMIEMSLVPRFLTADLQVIPGNLLLARVFGSCFLTVGSTG